MCLRLFRDPLRISYVRKKDLEDYAARHGMNLREYLRWWSKEFATNLALLHNTGMTHDNLIDHNVTRAGEIVDLNTVVRREIMDMREDVSYALCAVSHVSSLSEIPARGGHIGLALGFMKTYFENRQGMSVADRAILLSGCVDHSRAAGAIIEGIGASCATYGACNGDAAGMAIGAVVIGIGAIHIFCLQYAVGSGGRSLLYSLWDGLRRRIS